MRHRQPGPDVLVGGAFGSFKVPSEIGLVVRHGEGSALFSTDGRRFIDLVLGSGPMIIGHAHPRVVEAIGRQAAKGTTYYALNEPALQLADRIAELVPCAEAVKLVSTGAEATFYALRLARAFTKRPLIMKFDGSYHGHHDYAVNGVRVPPATNDRIVQSKSAGVPAGLTDTVLVVPYNNLAAAESIAMANADQLAAIIVEPIQRSIEPVPGFLEGLRALCDRIGAVLIFDEVVTGFRLAMGGAQEVLNVSPDLATFGKVIGGGLPVAAVAGRRDIIELSSPARAADDRSVFLSGTLNGNPLGAAAGLATLDVLVEENGPERLAERGQKLAEGLKEAAHKLSIPFQMIGPPAIAEPIFSDKKIVDAATYAQTSREATREFGIQMLRRGIFINPKSKLYISTTLTDDQISVVLEAGTAALRAVRDLKLVA